MKTEEIKIVDLQNIGLDSACPSEAEFREAGAQLDSAFKNIGFVYMKNHGVEAGLVEKCMDTSRKFFLQEENVKDRISRVDQQGWVAQGREIFDQAEDGSVAQMEIREAFDINKIDKAARFPDEDLPKFREEYTSLANQTIQLSQRILKALSLHFEKEEDFFSNKHRRILNGDNASAMRALYYPPILGSVPPGHIRCGEHSDYGTFTLLYQDTYPGLEVKSTSGTWVEAAPIQGSILVNIGDLLEMWTGGDYPATLHRVIIPEEETKKKAARQSIVFFVHPDDEVMVAPLEGENSKFPPVSALDHVTVRFAQTYQY